MKVEAKTDKTKRKLSRKQKIVNRFINSWVESDNNTLKQTESFNKNVKPNEDENSNVNSAVAQFQDPHLDPANIERIRNVIGYMYNDDRISLKLTFEQAGLLLEPTYDEKSKIFRFLVNDKEICQASGEQQEAHTKARNKLVEILNYYCYTVKRLKEFHTRRNVFQKIIANQPNDKHKFKDNALKEGNIGFQMLQKQGWTGGSLGASENGILEPIGVKKKTDKSGLGAVEEPQGPQKIPLEAFFLAIKRYASGNALYDLVFSTQFSKHQVIKLKDYASTLKLFPQIIGKKKQLVISKKLTISQIKIGVIKGHSDLCAKYAVIPPLCEKYK
ncbi:NF-kappa-B-repressing factor-like [Uranotaenia lowii]|uniref:NF-kappa-B-repressing factor-like n=1 Tax=Uranotaenia lowii TaxID=190385 RepID=UPI0024792109|nr:NF-kappa-B-repressing factor-like [Uranotaenia lowii]